MKTRAALAARLAESGVGAAVRDVAAPSIRVTARPSPRGPGSILGRSRFGGLPDVAEGAAWPVVDGVALSFIGQLDLRDLAPFAAADGVLPSEGLLSFFFDGALTGYDRGEAPDRARVIYTDTRASRLVRVERAPVPVAAAASARFAEEWTLPAVEELDGDEGATIPAIRPLLVGGEKERYCELRARLRGDFIGSRILGHADAVQGGEIRFNAVMRQDGGARFRYEDYEWTSVAELVDEMRDLVLLLQAASGDGEPWDGPGVVYFWIRRGDLAAGCWERAFALLQTT